MQKRLEGNIWKYTVLLVTNKRVFAAILGAYYLTIPGVTTAWIGMFLVIGSLTGFLFEIPSGYFSDKIGHKEALIISRIAAVLSTLFFLFADSIPFLILASIFLSLSSTFISGTGSAFMHETLRALKREGEYTEVMGRSSAIGFAVPIILTVLLPFLVNISYKIPFLIALVIDVIGLWVTCTLLKPPVSPEHIDEIGITNFKQVMMEGHRLKFFRHALFTGIIFGLLFATSTFRAPYQVLIGIPVIWFGVLHGVGRVCASLILAYSGRLKVLIGDVHAFYRFKIVVYGVLFLSLSLASLWWVIASIFVLINAFQWGLTKIGEGYSLEIIKTSKFKATLLSVKAQIGELFTALFGLGLGFAIQYSSYQFGFLTAIVSALLVLIPLYFYIERSQKKTEI
jgi:MFS family permease